MSGWYDRQGNVVYEVDSADGKRKIKPDIRHARKYGLLPRVSSILGIINNPSLEKWKQKELVALGLTSSYEYGDDIDLRVQAIIDDFQSDGQETMDLGSRVHAVCENYANICITGIMRESDLDAGMRPYLGAFINATKGFDFLWTEKQIIAEDFAGRADGMAERDGKRILYDIKTSTFKGDRPYIPESWLWQLCAYVDGLHGMNESIDQVANIILDKAEPGRYKLHIWNQEDMIDGIAIWRACKDLWKKINGYYPERESASF